MNDKIDAAETVRKNFNKVFESRTKDVKNEQLPRFSWTSSTVQKFMYDKYLKGHTVSHYLQDFLQGRHLKRGLELGGGQGRQAQSFCNMLNIDKFDVMDISDFAVDAGNKKSKEENLNLEYIYADLNHDDLPENTYDLIIASGSLHHIENLEHLFSQVNQSLTCDGIFFANDYMGPSHMQWTDLQLGLMDAILEMLPDRYRRCLHRDNEPTKNISRVPLAAFQRSDPSEGVRSADIFNVIEDHLELIEVVPFGQTILYELLRGRIHNFDDSDEKDKAILGLLCLFEKTLIDHKIIPSDFNLIIAKPKRSG